MDRAFFAQGQIPEEFITSAGDARPRFEALLAESEQNPAVGEAVAGLPHNLNVMVIAEPWSGDVLFFLPPILALARCAGWEVRIFPRDEYPELIEPYRKDNLYRSIPVVVFLDADFHELAAWIERPAKATTLIDAEMLKLRRQLREEHKAEWQAETLQEITELVQKTAR
jgi:hypothetical protein